LPDDEGKAEGKSIRDRGLADPYEYRHKSANSCTAELY